jgi:hypothetical protein
MLENLMQRVAYGSGAGHYIALPFHLDGGTPLPDTFNTELDAPKTYIWRELDITQGRKLRSCTKPLRVNKRPLIKLSLTNFALLQFLCQPFLLSQ